MAFASTLCISFLCALLTVTAVLAGIDDCAPLPPPNDGKVQLAFSTSDQLLAIYTCDKGYTAVGGTILSCVDGRWNKIPPLCASLDECELKDKEIDNLILMCPKLRSPRYGRMDNDLVNGGKMEVATFNCFKGYRMSGPRAIYCEEGFWRPTGRVPQCNPVECGEPEAPVNGTVEFEDTHFKAAAQYKCDACHVLNGYKRRSCKPSGLWSKHVPECVPMLDTPVCSLPDLELPERAVTPLEFDLSNTSMTCGQTVEIKCVLGYQLEGADTATCNSDGSFTWNGPSPSCNEL